MPPISVSVWPTWVAPWIVGSVRGFGAVPPPPPAPAPETASVGADEAETVPDRPTALTRTVSVRPTSAAFGVYVFAVAPTIDAHARPAASQRCH